MGVIELRTKLDCRCVMEQSLIGALFGGIVRTKCHQTLYAILIHLNHPFPKKSPIIVTATINITPSTMK